MLESIRCTCKLACCGLFLLVLQGGESAVADRALQYPCYRGYECIPNAEHFGYFRTMWRRWPGESRPGEDFPTAVGREVLPTPQGQKQPPPTKPTPVPRGPVGVPPGGQWLPGAVPPGGTILPGPDSFLPGLPRMTEPPAEPWAEPLLPGQPTTPQAPMRLDPPLSPMDAPPPVEPSDQAPDEPTIDEPMAIPPGGAGLPSAVPQPLAGAAETAPKDDRPHSPRLALQTMVSKSVFQQQSKRDPPEDRQKEASETLPRLAPPSVAGKPIDRSEENGEEPPKRTPQSAVAEAMAALEADEKKPPGAAPAAANGKSVDATGSGGSAVSEGGPSAKPRQVKALRANWMAALHPGFRGDVGRSTAMYPSMKRSPAASHPTLAKPRPNPVTQEPKLLRADTQPAKHVKDARQGDDRPVALDGFCPVELCSREQWTAGDPRWAVVYKGRTYLFAGPAQRQRFLDAPDRYVPMCSGNDPVLAADANRRVAGQTDYCVTYEGRLYMFSSSVTLKRFQDSPQRYATARRQ